MPGTRIDFSKKDCSSQLNGIYTSTGLRGMLEGKDYKNLDTVFPFVFAYVDTWLGQESTAPLTTIHTQYTSFVQQIMSDNNGLGWSTEALSNVQQTVASFKYQMTSLFHDCSPTGIATLKFHLLDHIIQDLQRFGSIRMLTASPFEHFNVHIKSAHASTSGRLLSRDAETVAALTFNLGRRTLADTISTRRSTGTDANQSTSSQKFGLVSHGVSIPLFHFVKLNHLLSSSPNTFLDSVKRNLPPDAFNQLCNLFTEEFQSTSNHPISRPLIATKDCFLD